MSRAATAPGDVLRRLHGERVLLIGGQRSLVLQLAHPMVAAAVDQHSDFPDHGLRRLRRTIDLTLAVLHGPDANRDRAAAHIRSVHERVGGTEQESGARYHATEPHLLLWVHATMVETALTVYRRFVGRLDEEEQRSYYESMKTPARLVGLSDGELPGTLEEFREYFRGMLAGSELRATDAGRALVDNVLRPRIPVVLRPGASLGRLVTIPLLPARIRTMFDLKVTPAARAALAAVSSTTRALVPRLPARLRRFPQAR